MDLKKILVVQNDLEHSEYEPSRQLSQEQQRQPEDQPAAKRKCLNEHLNEISGAAFNENNSRPMIDVKIGLDTINEDCFREICQYLNLFDIAQLGQTCMHLESFCNQVMFAKKVKLIEIKFWPSDGFTIKLDHVYSTKSLTVLTNAINYLGRFIEDFKYYYQGCVRGNTDLWRSIVHLMQHCKNLKTLKLCCVILDSNEAQEFQELIASLTSLKVLNLVYVGGLISYWSANNKHNFTIEKLSIQSGYEMEINDNFLGHFKNISSLDLVDYGKACRLSGILNHFGRCLKQLKLSCDGGYQSIASIISENLTNLKDLKITLRDEDFIDLPHLKSVQLIFIKNSINIVLRKLSEQGMIETLELTAGIFTSQGTNEQPLIFNKLHTIKYGLSADSSIIMAMANAQMPALRTVEITASSGVVLPELLKHVQLKKTIKSIHLELPKLVIPFEFWSQLIDILREPCAANREFIHLRISSEIVIGKKAWQLLKDNHHLLKVEQERKCLELIIN